MCEAVLWREGGKEGGKEGGVGETWVGMSRWRRGYRKTYFQLGSSITRKMRV
jgi:hypothetical protein